MRLNIEGMLAQRLAADDETTKRKAEKAVLTEGRDSIRTGTEGEDFVAGYNNAVNDVNVMPATLQRLKTEIFVTDAL